MVVALIFGLSSCLGGLGGELRFIVAFSGGGKIFGVPSKAAADGMKFILGLVLNLHEIAVKLIYFELDGLNIGFCK